MKESLSIKFIEHATSGNSQIPQKLGLAFKCIVAVSQSVPPIIGTCAAQLELGALHKDQEPDSKFEQVSNISVRTKVLPNEDYFSSLELDIFPTWKNPDGKTFSQTKMWINFTLANIAGGKLNYNTIKTDQELEKLLEKFNTVDKAQAKEFYKSGELHHIHFQYRSETNLTTCNLYSDNNADCMKQFNEISKLGNMLAGKEHLDINILTGCSEVVFSKTMLSLNTNLLQEAKNPDALSRWWKTKDGTPNLQLGQQIPEKDRKIIPYPFRANHLNSNELLTQVFYQAVQVAEKNKICSEPFEVAVRLMNLVHAGDRRYAVAIHQQDTNHRLEPGQSFHIFWTPDSVDSEGENIWSGSILESGHVENITDNFGIINRPFIKSGGCHDINSKGYWDDRKFPPHVVLGLDKQSSFEKIQTNLCKITPVKAWLKMQPSIQEQKNQINGMRFLYSEAVANKLFSPDSHESLRLLLGNEPNRLKTCGPFGFTINGGRRKVMPSVLEDCLKEIINSSKDHPFDDHQVAFLKNFINPVPGNVRLVTGPAGSGKSLTGVITPCVLINKVLKTLYDTKEPLLRERIRFPALVVGPTNDFMDDIASKIDADFKKRYQSDPTSKHRPVIVREHSKTAEEEAAWSQAEEVRIHNQPAHLRKPPVYITDEQIDIISVGATYLADHVNKAKVQKYPGITDPRVKNFELSMGHLVLQLSGAIKSHLEVDLNTLSEADQKQFITFRHSIRRWGEGETFSEAETIQLKEAYTTIVKYAYAFVVDIMVTTAGQAISEHVHGEFNPRFVFIDETSRIHMASIVALVARYYKEGNTCFTFVGDPFQLDPFQDLTWKDELLFPTSSIHKPMMKMMLSGFLRFNLPVQHRSEVSIVRTLEALGYETLEADPNVAKMKAQGPITALIKEMFGKHAQGHVGWLEVDTESAVDMYGSVHNEGNVDYAFETVLRAINCGVPMEDILIIAPYQAQVKMYQRLLGSLESLIEKMSLASGESNSRWSNIDVQKLRVTTVDNVQGCQGNLVIFDTTLTNNIGFLRVRSRVIVALSRARHGLICIGSMTKFKNDCKVPGRHSDYSKTYALLSIPRMCMEKRGTFMKMSTPSSKADKDTIVRTKRNRKDFPKPYEFGNDIIAAVNPVGDLITNIIYNGFNPKDDIQQHLSNSQKDLTKDKNRYFDEDDDQQHLASGEKDLMKEKSRYFDEDKE